MDFLIEIHPEDGFLGGEIRFRISRLIDKSGFRFSKSKSGFPNRTHPIDNDVISLLFLFFQYNFIEHTRLQLTFTKDNLQQNENYNLKLTKKKPNTIKTLVVLKWERNQLNKQNSTPYLRETQKQTILF